MLHKIPPEYAKDAKLISAYNKGYEQGYTGSSSLSEANFTTYNEGQAFAIGKKTGERRKEKELNGIYN